MTRLSTLRASDSDRERIAERLRSATAEGRLLAEELEERLGAAFSARTYGELDSVVADLPGDRVARRERSLAGTWAPRLVALVFAAALATVVVLAVLAVVTGLAIWLFWMVVAWWLFGHRHRTGGPWGHHPAPHRRPWY